MYYLPENVFDVVFALGIIFIGVSCICVCMCVCVGWGGGRGEGGWGECGSNDN